jgi:4-hydroxy-3-polyprenylbenzoate decarboxylase
MAFKDLREFIAALQGYGLAVDIKQDVHWNLEVGAITRRVNELGAPSPLFSKITGYPDGYRIFGAPINTWPKAAVALGLDPDVGAEGVCTYLRKKMGERIKPVVLDRRDAPCKENIVMGDDVDVRKFPAPVSHDGDGGRYISTWHCNVTRDPETGWVNWGMYRSMIASKNTLTGVVRPTIHMGYHYFRHYKKKKMDMPFAIAIGPEPVSAFMACSKPPAGVDEVEIAGALRGQPVELVKCETNDLQVPATSEIVFEGVISATEKDFEGPFGEWTGYSANVRDERPIYKINCITYRNDPILTYSCTGTPTDESGLVIGAWRSAELTDVLEKEGIPVTGVYYPPECAVFLAVVGMKSSVMKSANIAQRISSRIFGSEIGNNLPYIIVVDEDVDIYNLNDVMHAFVTKCHPYRGITRLEHATGFSFMPFLNGQERLLGIGAKAYFDCTWPLQWDPITEIPPKTSFRTRYPREVQEHVLANWESYGLGDKR